MSAYNGQPERTGRIRKTSTRGVEIPQSAFLRRIKSKEQHAALRILVQLKPEVEEAYKRYHSEGLARSAQQDLRVPYLELLRFY